MTSLIIEDEHHSAVTLQNLITQYCEGISCNGIYHTVDTALEGIKERNPDLVFLDIMLKNQNGFDLLETLPRPHPQIIFTTAFDHYAIRAVRFSALDYLLKPISIKELQAAVKRAHHNLNKYGLDQLNELMKSVKGETEKIKKLAIPTFEGHLFVNVEDIIRFEADGSYTKVILVNEQELLVSRQLKEYEIMLKQSGFLRTHHSHMVNTSHIEKYIRGNGGYLIMSDGRSVAVSQRKKDDLLSALKIS